MKVSHCFFFSSILPSDSSILLIINVYSLTEYKEGLHSAITCQLNKFYYYDHETVKQCPERASFSYQLHLWQKKNNNKRGNAGNKQELADVL